MGFGYVFLGCLLTVNIPYHSYTDVFAVALMLLGLSTLAPYAKGFAGAFRAGLPLLAVSLVRFVLSVLQLLNLFSLPLLSSSLTLVGYVCKFFFFWLFFMGVDEVAKQTDIPKLRAHAMRSRFLTPVFCLMGLLPETGLFTVHTAFLQYYLLGFLLFGLIYALLNSKTVYECYMLICFEGEEEMDEKPSRFSFFGKGDREDIPKQKNKRKNNK